MSDFAIVGFSVLVVMVLCAIAFVVVARVKLSRESKYDPYE